MLTHIRYLALLLRRFDSACQLVREMSRLRRYHSARASAGAASLGGANVSSGQGDAGETGMITQNDASDRDSLVNIAHSPRFGAAAIRATTGSLNVNLFETIAV